MRFKPTPISEDTSCKPNYDHNLSDVEPEKKDAPINDHILVSVEPITDPINPTCEDYVVPPKPVDEIVRTGATFVNIDSSSSEEESSDEEEEDVEGHLNPRQKLEKLLKQCGEQRKDSKKKSKLYSWIDKILTGILIIVSAIVVYFGSSSANAIITICAAFMVILRGIHSIIRPERKAAFLEYEGIELDSLIDDISDALKLPKKEDLTEFVFIIKDQLKTWQKKAFSRKKKLPEK